MTDIGSSIMVASMIVGMLTVPAASTSIDGSNNVSESIPDISGSENVPKEVSTNTSSSSFTRTVETAFQEFSTQVSSESAKTSVESANSRLQIEKNPEKTVWELESSEGTLRIERSSSKTVEKVETPYGSLETTRINGGVRESFEGSNREQVEEVAENLREMMEEKREEIEERKTETVSDRYSRSIEIEKVNGSADFVKIRSTSSREIDLDGWKLTDNAGEATFGEEELDSVELPPEGVVYVYTSSEDEAEVSEDDDAVYVYDSGLAWNTRSSGDTATLWRNGEEVAQKSY